jgi:hypothetical protein
MSQTHVFILEQGTSDDRNTAIGRIFTCLSDGTQGHDLLNGLRSAPDGITVSADHKYIFWTNMGHPSSDGWTNTGSIQRCDIDGKNVVTVIEPGTKTHTPKQLTIAEKSRKLYWCDREGMRVMRSDLDGENVETLVRNGDVENAEHRKDYLRWCVGIQVDEAAGYIYWSQKGPPKGGKGKILRCPIAGAGPDGENIEVLFDHLPEPIDLSLDVLEGWIYWTDRGEQVLCSIEITVADSLKYSFRKHGQSSKDSEERREDEPRNTCTKTPRRHWTRTRCHK